MKKLFFLIMPIMAFCVFSMTSCSKDDGEPELTREEKAAKTQNELYDKVKSVIVGHWVGVQHYNTSVFRSVGWEDISYISWDREYSFNADGTLIYHHSDNLTYTGKYTITKNEDYLKYPTTECELWLTFTLDNNTKETHCVWLDGEYLRIGYAIMGIKPSSTSGGEASIRYAKK